MVSFEGKAIRNDRNFEIWRKAYADTGKEPSGSRSLAGGYRKVI